MISLHNSIGGIKNLLSFTNSKDEEAALNQVILGLNSEPETIFRTHSIKKFKGIGANVFEIKKNKLRICYMFKDGNIVILHAFRKQKGKTEKKDLEIIRKRSKDFN
ncbi:MAG: type II toxin-antitoxin system RelE/ParE family toxin [Clostridium paraputrificum]